MTAPAPALADLPLTRTKATPGWQRRAACRGMDTDSFIETGYGQIPKSLLAVCKACPVRLDCVIFAIDTRSEGVWGGTGRPQRRRIARVLREARAEQEATRG